MYNNYNYSFSITYKDEFEKTDTVKVDFKARDDQEAICKIEKIVNTFLNSAGYVCYDKDRILLKSMSEEEEIALGDFLDFHRAEKEAQK